MLMMLMLMLMPIMLIMQSIISHHDAHHAHAHHAHHTLSMLVWSAGCGKKQQIASSSLIQNPTEGQQK